MMMVAPCGGRSGSVGHWSYGNGDNDDDDGDGDGLSSQLLSSLLPYLVKWWPLVSRIW